jgi:hypothetical protein
MAKKGLLLGMLIVALVFCLAFVGCDNGTTDDDDDTTVTNPFVGSWLKDNTSGYTVLVTCTENTWVAHVTAPGYDADYVGGGYNYVAGSTSFAVDTVSYPSFTGSMAASVANGKMVLTGFTGAEADKVNGTYSKQ